MAENLAIIEKIIADASVTAKEIISQAKADVDEILSLANSQSDEYLTRQREALKKECQLVKERKNTVATLDGRKISLKAKQELIDDCFVKAEEKVLNLPKEKYLEYVKSLLVKYAENGEEVVLGKTEKVVTKEFIEKVASEMKIKFTVSANTENYVGGIILRSKTLDKNLTLKATLRGLREETEQETAKILFD
ncbi:MAG: V-type ATP synthase subunit E family protein [Clostridia bacterium]